MQLNSEHLAALAALANAIIPADEKDGGAASVNAGPSLADKIASGVNAALYAQGLEFAATIALERYHSTLAQLNPKEAFDLMSEVQEMLPAFFKQLRLDVSAMYLSDPRVWERIGFPGPSTRSGGYPDFDQPQTAKITILKEATT